ncbi:response regulator [bacterium]|nr:response regulator [bacterium]
MESKKQTILIVEDSKSQRAIIRQAFFEENCELIFCADGKRAQGIYLSHRPDLVMLDVELPGQSGFDLCRWIKQQTAEEFVPVMMLTVRDEVEDKVYGLESGADEYLTKPFAFAELNARVKALLRIRNLTKELKQTQISLKLAEQQLFRVQLAAGAAHELGQPLTVIQIHSGLLKNYANSEKIQTVAQTIEQNCRIMKQTLEKLLRLREFKSEKYIGVDSITKIESD